MANYVIKKGDNLTTIAKQYGTTVNALAKANNISNPSKIIAGKKITIPSAKTTNTTKEPLTFKNPTKPTTAKAQKPPSLTSIETSRPTYTQSDDVLRASEMLKQYETNKPGAYQSSYSDQISSLLNQIQNREKFNYDMNADPLYQQYKDQYTNAGQMAMMDTMGNASSLSGGYGNSYATTAGNQAYQANLQQLNNVIPELYSAAYGKYQNDGNELYNQAGLLQSQDQVDYGRHQDGVNEYYNDLNYYYNKYGDMSTQDYNQYANNLGAWENDRNYYYGKEQDSLSQSNYLQDLARQKSLDQQGQSNWEKEYALNVANVNSTIAKRNSSGSSGGTSKKKISKEGTKLKGSTTKVDTTDYYAMAESKLNNGNIDSVKNYIADLYADGKLTQAEVQNLYSKIKEVDKSKKYSGTTTRGSTINTRQGTK